MASVTIHTQRHCQIITGPIRHAMTGANVVSLSHILLVLV
jgi:hypothetical protein